MEHADGLRLALEAGGRQLRVVDGGRVARQVAAPTATPSSGATDWIREAVFTASPVMNRSPDPGATSRRTSASPELIPTRSAERPVAAAASQIARPARTARSGVVFVRRRDAEHAHDRVADELLDDPAVRADRRTGHRRVGVEHPADVFGVGLLRHGRKPDEVAEQDADDLALLDACRGDRRGRERLAARRTEARTVRALRKARRAHDHGPERYAQAPDVEAPPGRARGRWWR